MIKTKLECNYPIYACIEAFEDFTELDRYDWVTTNDYQRRILNNRKWLAGIETEASYEVQVVNKFLKDQGLDIQLSPITGAPGIYVAAVLSLAMKWRKKGFESIVKSGEKYYKGFSLHNSLQGTNFDIYGNHTFVLRTEDEMYDVSILVKKEIPYDTTSILIPTIKIDLITELKDLVGMSNKLWIIAEAIQQTKLKLTHEGFEVKSGAAISVVSGSATTGSTFTLDEAFELSIRKRGYSEPIIHGVIGKDSWEKIDAVEATVTNLIV